MLQKKLDAFRSSPLQDLHSGETLHSITMWSGPLNGSASWCKSLNIQATLVQFRGWKVSKRSNHFTTSCSFYSFGNLEWTQFSSPPSLLRSNIMKLQDIWNRFVPQWLPWKKEKLCFSKAPLGLSAPWDWLSLKGSSTSLGALPALWLFLHKKPQFSLFRPLCWVLLGIVLSLF